MNSDAEAILDSMRRLHRGLRGFMWASLSAGTACLALALTIQLQFFWGLFANLFGAAVGLWMASSMLRSSLRFWSDPLP